MPFIRHIVLHVQSNVKSGLAKLLFDLFELVLQRGSGETLEGTAAFSGGVSHMNQNVGNRVVVKLPDLNRQFEPPSTDCATALEWQVTIVAEIQFEHAAVVL